MINENKPNIIIITIDAGRRDYFGCYGEPPERTPNIDKLARKSVLFENVISTAPWTLPSHGSMFTGLYPHQHGATWKTLRLNQGVPTIFDILQSEGYQSVAVSANSLIVSPYNMFGDNTRILSPLPHNHPDKSSFDSHFNPEDTCSERITGYFMDYLNNPARKEPFIAYINYYDLHAKYSVRQPFYEQFVSRQEDQVLKEVGDYYELLFKEVNDKIQVKTEWIKALQALYAAKLAMIDSDIGKILRTLEDKKLLENTVIILTSDHGDILGDQKKPSFHHQFSIHNSLLEIPLIIFWPDVKPLRYKHGLIQNIDILPTILEILNMKPPEELVALPGVSLIKLINKSAPVRKFAVSFYDKPARFVLRNRKKVNRSYIKNLKAIQDGRYKLVLQDNNIPKLYDLKYDPAENENIHSKNPDLVNVMTSFLKSLTHQYKPVGNNNSSYEKEEVKSIVSRLQALGYIE